MSCRSVCQAMPRTMRRSSSGPSGRAPPGECLPAAHQAASPQASARLLLGVTLCRQPQAQFLPHQVCIRPQHRVCCQLGAKRLWKEGCLHNCTPPACTRAQGLCRQSRPTTTSFVSCLFSERDRAPPADNQLANYSAIHHIYLYLDLCLYLVLQALFLRAQRRTRAWA